MNEQILINFGFIGWSALLALFSKDNLNLRSMLLLMMIPKIIDMAILTPILMPMKVETSELFQYRRYFYLIHAANDLLMIAILRYRYWFSILFKIKFVYRKMWQERVILTIFTSSIFINTAMFSEYFYREQIDINQMFIYNNYTQLKQLLLISETALLTWLTIQTARAVIKLRKRKLIRNGAK